MTLPPISDDEHPDDLHFDVPTTPEDVEALRRVRHLGVPSFAEFLEWLSSQPTDVEALAKRKLPIGYEPFTLEDE